MVVDDPSLRWKLGEDSKKLREDIRRSPRVRALLAGAADHVYAKWQGAHWVLSTLADLGYPPGDESLAPLRDRVLDCWLDERYYREFEALGKKDAYRGDGVPVIAGRARRCASQQGNALHFLTTLGLSDGREKKLIERLLHWQWPDGGWNCDKNAKADTSSFMETLYPMLGLAAAGGHACAVDRAAEVFLSRGLFRRRRDGRPIHPEFLKLHYPLYWHYDVLAGLKAMAKIGRIRDPRCSDALDLLERKRLSDGGWPAEARYYKVSNTIALGADWVDWGGTSSKRMNPWVTADALAVLRAARRSI